MFCPICGTSVISRQVFCVSCGTRLDTQSQDSSVTGNSWSNSGVNLDELNAPSPMRFVEAIKFSYKNYFRFSGRASRSEYWYWTLFNVLGYITAYIAYIGYWYTYRISWELDFFLYEHRDQFGFLFLVFVLSTIIPGLSRGVRRLHDTNKSGALLFLGLIPLVGAVLLLVFFATDGDVGPNRYGPPNNRI
jgi:uncharacterized membrane protein YhaH (DUF805 family)